MKILKKGSRTVLSLVLAIAAMSMSGKISAQVIGIKTNLLQGAYTYTPNLGMEIGLGKKTTLDISGGYNPWNLDGKKNGNKKAVHWAVQPEFRWWTCSRFAGHFLGVHGLYSMYNIGGHELPLLFGKGSWQYRHEGWAAGAGISYGYHWVMSPRWSFEFTIGGGYARLEYDRYACQKCGWHIEHKKKDYFGPTKAAVTLIFMIK